MVKGRKIICLENKKEYTVSEAAKELNLRDSDIRAVLRKKQKSVGGYHFVYSDEYNENTIYDLSVGLSGRKVICTDNMKVYDSARLAGYSLQVDSSSILKVCKNQYKNAKGYHFSFWEENKTFEKTERETAEITKKIICFENNKCYNSIRLCAKDLSLDPSTISKVCQGKLKSTKGYHFKYVS